jgi:hypothetical protein
MARLIVNAVVTQGLARARTRDPVPATVSVTRNDGTPVTTLTATNFTVGDTWGTNRLDVVGFLGGTIQIGPGATNGGGLYLFQLVPILGAVWTSMSTYHIVIAVAGGGDHGQTIAELTFRIKRIRSADLPALDEHHASDASCRSKSVVSERQVSSVLGVAESNG